MAGPRFDPTINFGHILTFGGLVGAAVIGYGVMSGAVDGLAAADIALDARLARLELALTPLATTTQVNATRITWLENQVVIFNNTITQINTTLAVLRELVAGLRATVDAAENP